MKKWLQKKLRQFLCEHKNCEWQRDIKTTLEEPNLKEGVLRDNTQEPEAVQSQLLRFKRWCICKDCKAEVVISYNR